MKKIYDLLKSNPQFTFLARYLLRHGAGSIPPEAGMMEVEKWIAMELEDGEELTGPGDWHYEIAKMVRKSDLERMRHMAQDIFGQDPKCPECEWESRVSIRAGKYYCRHCKFEWQF